MAKILDCTLRDGGYLNNWKFNKDFQVDYLTSLYNVQGKNLVEYLEVGYVDRELSELRYALEINKLKSAVMLDVAKPKIDFRKLYCDLFKYYSPDINLIRFAVAPEDIQWLSNNEFFQKVYKLVKKENIKIAFNLMRSHEFISNNTRKKQALITLKQYSPDIIYFADSYGCLNYKDIKELYEYGRTLLRLDNTKPKLGAHLHNNLNRAHFLAVYADILGFDYIDSTVAGIGRGAGNTRTEDLLSYYQQDNQSIKKLIQSWGIIPLETNQEFKDGAKAHQHPNVAINRLEQRGDYCASQIWVNKISK